LKEDIKPVIHPSVFIADGAVIVGDVIIEQNASIWFNSIVRGDTEKIRIGQNTNIQDGSILHSDKDFPLIIGDNVTAGHRVILHGCIIENNVLIGMGAVIMNGAKIGTGAIIASGSVVLEKTIIPPYSMAAGTPAITKKSLDKKTAEKNKETALHYVTLKDGYLEHK